MNEQKLLKLKERRQNSLDTFKTIESIAGGFNGNFDEFKNKWWSQHSGLEVSYIEALRAGLLPFTPAITRQLLVAIYPLGAPDDIVDAIVGVDNSFAKLFEVLQKHINDE